MFGLQMDDSYQTTLVLHIDEHSMATLFGFYGHHMHKITPKADLESAQSHIYLYISTHSIRLVENAGVFM